jgi:hypothetical protein
VLVEQTTAEEQLARDERHGTDRPRGRPVLARLPAVPWTAVHLGSLGLGAFVVFVANRNQWFFGDEWEFIVNRGPEDQRLGLFTAHNEHWSTLPILIYRALLATVGLRSYAPYVAVLVVLHIALAHLLWRAALRVGARPAIATALAAIFAVLGAGAENLLWAFQIGFVGCIMFGWAQVLLADHDGPFGGRDLLGWAAGTVALMMSGPAILMVGVATLTVALRRRRLVDAALTALGPFVVYALWWLAAGRHAHSGAPPSENGRWLLVDFAWRGVTNMAEQVVGIPGGGAVLVVALLYWWSRHLEVASGRGSLAYAGTFGAFAFFLVTGVGRVDLGVDSAASGRYVYIGAALVLPAAALALSRSMPTGTKGTLFVLALCGVVATHNVGLLREAASRDWTREQSFRDLVLAGAQLVRDGEPVLPDVDLDPNLNPDLGTVDLVRIVGYDWLPEGSPALADTLTARTMMQVADAPAEGALASVGLSGREATVEPRSPVGGASCLHAVPSGPVPVLLLQDDAAAWRVRLGSDHPVSLQVAVVDGTTTGIPRSITLDPGEPLDLVSVAGEQTLSISVPAEGLTVCGVVPSP